MLNILPLTITSPSVGRLQWAISFHSPTQTVFISHVYITIQSRNIAISFIRLIFNWLTCSATMLITLFLTIYPFPLFRTNVCLNYTTLKFFYLQLFAILLNMIENSNILIHHQKLFRLISPYYTPNPCCFDICLAPSRFRLIFLFPLALILLNYFRYLQKSYI